MLSPLSAGARLLQLEERLFDLPLGAQHAGQDQVVLRKIIAGGHRVAQHGLGKRKKTFLTVEEREVGCAHGSAGHVASTG